MDENEPLIIDCATCVMKDTSACSECVVSFVLDPPEGAIVFDAEEERAIRAMSSAGLLPMVQYKPKQAG